MATRKPTSVTLTVNDLHRLLRPVIPFAGVDGMLPVLRTVRVCRRGDYLTAIATDRFRMGMQRIWPEEMTGDFDALLKLADLKELLKLVRPRPKLASAEGATVTLTKPPTSTQVHLAVGGGLAFEVTDLQLTLRTQEGEYPNIDALLTDNLEPEKLAAAVEPYFAVNPRLFDAFVDASTFNGKAVLVVRGSRVGSTSVGRGPVLVQVGEDFIGGVMGRHPQHDVGAGTTFGGDWHEFITATASKPSSKSSRRAS